MMRVIRRECSNLSGAYSRFQRDDGAILAAAVAYYLGLSFFPLILVLVSGLGLFLEYSRLGQSAEEQILDTLAVHLSPSFEQHVAGALSNVKDRSVLTGPIGLIGILIASIAGFAQFERAFNRIWNMPQPESQGILAGLRSVLIKRGIAFLILLSLGLLVVAVFLAEISLTAVEKYAGQLVPLPEWLSGFARYGIALAFNVLVFTLVYRWLPRVRVRWNEALRGAIVAAVGWEIGRQLLTWYLTGNQLSSAYGVIGSFIAIQLWCFFAVALIFLGASYIQEFCHACDD